MIPAKALRAIESTDIVVFAQNLDLDYTWFFNHQNSWLHEAAVGANDRDLLVGASGERAIAAKREVLRSRKPARLEVSVAQGASTRWYDLRVEADIDEAGAVVGLIGSLLDITEQKRREDTLKTLLRELSHRSKNLLAIIQSLASQTARHSLTVPEFLVRFRGRIQSLSSSQDIVTDTDWRGADLMSLITMQVERYAPDGMEQIKVSGVDVYLSPTASLHVGLALHELAVNAASYGSLSVPGGTVAISSQFEQHDDETFLRLVWTEANGPRVKAEHDPRFGTSTLERIVPNAVGGEAFLEYQPAGIAYTLMIPEAQFEIIEAPARFAAEA
ncbi:PAS domain-containing sensor histidine kinase [Antarcticirhabdus aurantiaca]|uniref:PAS domain-containing protein n=1 Tax=Antarcticirhabdus aurantiaca TaxID=2606717 RepID=A0ACD4NTU7_9HYPH|nr:PAS domain-containing sensor histidine kinase [Antarcticirhabdus aurantiaca]WAJ30012.1 PAS domain-containing protein [Jeongeuplla avenae]